ncbi:hypothetical protein [Aquimarina sp. 2201CG5-10]|uniref:hypothetical protein n=1 Tax=Aquimarina callyspongiae TaxID=3098150 RepID=UPI002AB3F4F7|nr:hypothetical protein [Aquimarina sp. 2201CG5-10]MDY8137337.1 hypothetical protein [Aquimarina sp. 2201CG5-10]
MKKHLLFSLLFSLSTLYVSPNILDQFDIITSDIQSNNDRKLPEEEVRQRGIDLMANQIVEDIDEIDLRKMARSSIFETSYGFRWKMVNLHTGKIIIIKVNKNFELISARNSDNSKIMTP